MKLPICLMLVFFIASAAIAGELYGTIVEAGKPIPAGVKIEILVAGKRFTGETDKFGTYHVFAAEKGNFDTSNAEFWVGYFDFPMIDNTRLPHDQRAAVVLNAFEDGAAAVTLGLFPGSYASLKDKASLQEVLQNLMKTENTLPSKQ